MTTFRPFVVAVLACLIASASALAQPLAPERRTRIVRASRGVPLSQPSSASPSTIVDSFLRARGHSDATVRSAALIATQRSAATGLTHVRFEQRVGEIAVYGAYVKASLTARGELVSVIENLVPVPAASVLPGRSSPDAALASAIRHLHGDAVMPPGLARQEGPTTVYARSAFFHRGPRVTPVAVARADGLLGVVHLVETWTAKGNLLHHTLVGGGGEILHVELRTNNDSYRIFQVDPEKGGQVVVSGPGAGNAQSPAGWLTGSAHTSVNIAGNNVATYVDADANNTADGGGTPVTDGNFLATADLTASPGTNTNRAVSVQNLFYLNNLIHDTLFTHGFNEAAGNFQEQNFGADGLGSDSVNAEAQDGSGTDNANFATPPDGQNPRMQMYLWSPLGSHEVVVAGSAVSDGRYIAQGAAFGPPLDLTGITGPIALVTDSAGTHLACGRLPRGSLTGAVALVDRGTCAFVDKVLNAQRAGAIAVIIANNVPEPIFAAGGSGTGIRIPAAMISQDDGMTLKASAGDLGSATLRIRADAPPMRDSALDSDIVWHEYGHGLTWRMIGGMSGPIAGAIGEGMSDVLAILINDDDVVAEYSASDAAGIRSAPYTGYARTYADFDNAGGVHFNGEIYAAIGWRLWENFQNARPNTDLGKDQLLTYLVEGMNATPSTPAFEDMRDGILAAIGDPGSQAHCLVWDAFADFGVGVGASASISKRGVVTIVESMALPAECSAASLTTNAND